MASTPRYDWFQTNNAVTLSIYEKGVKQEDVAVSLDANMLHVSICQMDRPVQFLDVVLAGPVSTDAPSVTVYASKIEVCMAKAEPGVAWSAFELKHGAEAPLGTSTLTSSKDWEKIFADLDKDPELARSSDDALNSMFQGIYANASDDSKKAMIKSFTESGGTCLSTDWTDVANKKTPFLPPK